MKKFVLIPFDEWTVIKREKSLPAKEIFVPTQQARRELPPLSAPTKTSATLVKEASADTPPNLNSFLRKKKKTKKLPHHQKMSHLVGGEETTTTRTPVIPWMLQLKHFAPKYQNRARKLIHLLRNSNRIRYNRKMEVLIDGERIANSNIIQLVEHAVSTKNTNKLVGVKRFYNLLFELGIPNTLVKNQWGKNLVQKKRKGPHSTYA